MSFDDWMAQVDQELINRCGMSSRDLPDTHYYDMFDDGVSAKEAAEEAFEHAFYS